MFGFIKTLFSAPKLADTAASIVTGGISAIDALVFTDEEKVTAQRDTYKLWLEAQKILRDESSVRSITRRILAVIIIGSFLLMLFWAAIVWPWRPEWSAFILGCAKNLNNLVLAIGVFYFGSYALGKYIMPGKEK